MNEEELCELKKRLAEAEHAALGSSVVLGGLLGNTRSWDSAITTVGNRVDELQRGRSSPVKVEVVFHVAGEVLGNEFEGIRTGRYDKQKRLLVVQVAESDELSEHPEQDIRQMFIDSIDVVAN